MDFTKDIVEAVDRKDMAWFLGQSENPAFREFIAKPVFSHNENYPQGPIHHARSNPRILALLFKIGASPDAMVMSAGGGYHSVIGSIIA